MQNTNKTFILLHIGILFTVMAMELFQATDPFGLRIILLLISIFISKPILKKDLSLIDLTILLIYLYDLTLCFFSINSLQTIHATFNSTVYILTYILLRRIINNTKQLSFFLDATCLLIGVALILSLSSFLIFNHSVKIAQFTDTYHVRFLFHPLGYSSNAWATVLFSFLGICSITCYISASKYKYWFSLLLIGLTIYAILLSFSRGAYITLGIYLIIFLFTVKSPKIYFATLFSILIIGGIVGYTFPQEIRTTLRMNKTVSQQQSNKGRIQAIYASTDVFKNYMIMGSGTGNYTLAIDKQLNQDSTLGFTSFAPNIIVRWAIEKGIMGLTLYGFMIFAICFNLWKQRKSIISVIAGCILLAIFIKELTLSTIQSTPISAFTLYILLALLQFRPSTDIYIHITKRRQYAAVFFTSVYLVLEIFIIQHIYDEKSNKKSYLSFQKGNYQEAIRDIEQTKRKTPYLVNRGILYMECYKHYHEPIYLDKAEQSLIEAGEKTSEDLYIDYLSIKLLLLKGEYKLAHAKLNKLIACYPKNALFRKKLFHLLYNTDKKEEAFGQLEESILLVPSILKMKDIEHLNSTDSILYQNMIRHLLMQKPNKGDSPATFAHYGYIAYHCDKLSQAKQSLEKALSLLPNLSTPWYLLGRIYEKQQKEVEALLCLKKYKLLTKGAFQDITSSETSIKENDLPEKNLMDSYALKFNDWYVSELLYSHLKDL